MPWCHKKHSIQVTLICTNLFALYVDAFMWPHLSDESDSGVVCFWLRCFPPCEKGSNPCMCGYINCGTRFFHCVKCFTFSHRILIDIVYKTSPSYPSARVSYSKSFAAQFSIQLPFCGKRRSIPGWHYVLARKVTYKILNGNTYGNILYITLFSFLAIIIS